ncbi:hypothetical protein [Neisseria dumasiana]|uniref:hypothetical protein n=1 Tax=Neisseria dumasiana TaxID=1931275 RepID=UPI00209C5BE4|nr:hypothetical protein [Neisseria dumasiana]
MDSWDKSQWNEIEKNRCETILIVIRSMRRSPDLWQKYCKFNINNHGKDFSDILNRLHQQGKDPKDIPKLSRLYLRCLQFVAELYFSDGIEEFGCESTELIELIKKLKNKAFESHDIQDPEIYDAFYKTPLKMLYSYEERQEIKKFLESVQEINNFQNTISTSQNNLSNTKKDLESIKDDIAQLNKKIDDFKTTVNFVELFEGFQSLLNKKNQAKWWTFAGLVTLLLTALIPLCFSFYKFIQGIDLSWQKMLPVIGLEFVLIYFFRVVLTHYHSIQTQIMQLELRQSLCQFIQRYVEYAQPIKTSIKNKDKNPLEKFENLIFSSILSNPDKVPGTFDGIDGLTSLLKEIKGSK